MLPTNRGYTDRIWYQFCTSIAALGGTAGAIAPATHVLFPGKREMKLLGCRQFTGLRSVYGNPV